MSSFFTCNTTSSYNVHNDTSHHSPPPPQLSHSNEQINIAAPTTGQQKVIEIDDEKRLQNFYERRVAQEIDGDVLGEEFAGYVFRISGGNDKQGFPMRQGVLTNTRVRLLCAKGHKAYRPRRAGERKRKSVRGCIVGQDISVLNLVVTKMGDNTVPGLTDEPVPRRLGPKRANKIRKLFNLEKDDDVRQVRHCPHLHQQGRQGGPQGSQDPASRHPPHAPAQASSQGCQDELRPSQQGGGGRLQEGCCPTTCRAERGPPFPHFQEKIDPQVCQACRCCQIVNFIYTVS